MLLSLGLSFLQPLLLSLTLSLGVIERDGLALFCLTYGAASALCRPSVNKLLSQPNASSLSPMIFSLLFGGVVAFAWLAFPLVVWDLMYFILRYLIALSGPLYWLVESHMGVLAIVEATSQVTRLIEDDDECDQKGGESCLSKMAKGVVLLGAAGSVCVCVAILWTWTSIAAQMLGLACVALALGLSIVAPKGVILEGSLIALLTTHCVSIVYTAFFAEELSAAGAHKLHSLAVFLLFGNGPVERPPTGRYAWWLAGTDDMWQSAAQSVVSAYAVSASTISQALQQISDILPAAVTQSLGYGWSSVPRSSAIIWLSTASSEALALALLQLAVTSLVVYSALMVFHTAYTKLAGAKPKGSGKTDDSREEPTLYDVSALFHTTMLLLCIHFGRVGTMTTADLSGFGFGFVVGLAVLRAVWIVVVYVVHLADDSEE